MNRFFLLCISVLFAACGSSGGSGSGGNPPPPPPPPPPAVDASASGTWTGIASDGGIMTFFVSEAGDLHVVQVGTPAAGPDKIFTQGFGTLSVSNGNSVASSYQLIQTLGDTFSGGGTSLNCQLTGTVTEGQTMTVDSSCGSYQFMVTLDYNSSYERDSSLATVAGNYQGLNEVLSIAGDGVFFSQDPVTGCVVNGQVSIIDSGFNLYDIEFMYSSCLADLAALNGYSFTGMAVLDDSVMPEVLNVFAIGQIENNAFAAVAHTYERL